MRQGLKFSDVAAVISFSAWLIGAFLLEYARAFAPEYNVPTISTELCNLIQFVGVVGSIVLVVADSRKSGVSSKVLFKDAFGTYQVMDTLKDWVISFLAIFILPFLWWTLIVYADRVAWIYGFLGIAGFIVTGVFVREAIWGFYKMWLYRKTQNKRLYRWTLLGVRGHRCHSCDEYNDFVSDGYIQTNPGPRGGWSAQSHVKVCSVKCLRKQLDSFR